MHVIVGVSDSTHFIFNRLNRTGAAAPVDRSAAARRTGATRPNKAVRLNYTVLISRYITEIQEILEKKIGKILLLSL